MTPAALRPRERISDGGGGSALGFPVDVRGVPARSVCAWEPALARRAEAPAAGCRHRAGPRRGAPDRVAEPERLACRAPDEPVVRLLVLVEVLADRGDRHETVGAALLQLDEQAGARDAADAALEVRRRRARQARRRSSRSTVSRSAAMARRSATEISPAMRSSCASSCGRRPPAPRLSAEISDAVDEEVGVAADRRGEMGVAAEVEAEMADVLAPRIPPGSASAGPPR